MFLPQKLSWDLAPILYKIYPLVDNVSRAMTKLVHQDPSCSLTVNIQGENWWKFFSLFFSDLGIAMSTGGSARWTRGSTTMTVYRCKDCESCKYKDERLDLENFAIIAEIQNKTNTIPGVTVEFVASDSHMTVCFEQANFCPEEIYGISNETVPPKFWSGILNTGGMLAGNLVINWWKTFLRGNGTVLYVGRQQGLWMTKLEWLGFFCEKKS